jgi:hypothetical protein
MMHTKDNETVMQIPLPGTGVVSRPLTLTLRGM